MLATWVAIGLAVTASQADVDRCLGIEDDAARLACYDRLFERRGPAPAAALPAASVTSAPAPATRTAPAREAVVAEPVPPAPESAFGLTVDQRPEGKVQSISGTVAEVEPSAAGRHVIVLDNGQRWRQLEATTRPAFSSGDTVEIRRAALGSYLATVPGSGRRAVRVRRED